MTAKLSDLGILGLVFLAACGKPTIDFSSAESAKKSSDSAGKPLDDVKKKSIRASKDAPSIPQEIPAGKDAPSSGDASHSLPDQVPGKMADDVQEYDLNVKPLSKALIKKYAKIRNVKLQIEALKSALAIFRSDVGRYPTTDEGMNALLHCPNSDKWLGPYIDPAKFKKMPTDSWDHPFQYASPGKHSKNLDSYDVWSMGPDGINGTDDDIGNWEK
jgi:general secretion pathway protein G